MEDYLATLSAILKDESYGYENSTGSGLSACNIDDDGDIQLQVGVEDIQPQYSKVQYQLPLNQLNTVRDYIVDCLLDPAPFTVDTIENLDLANDIMLPLVNNPGSFIISNDYKDSIAQKLHFITRDLIQSLPKPCLVVGDKFGRTKNIEGVVVMSDQEHKDPDILEFDPYMNSEKFKSSIVLNSREIKIESLDLFRELVKDIPSYEIFMDHDYIVNNGDVSIGASMITKKNVRGYEFKEFVVDLSGSYRPERLFDYIQGYHRIKIDFFAKRYKMSQKLGSYFDYYYVWGNDTSCVINPLDINRGVPITSQDIHLIQSENFLVGEKIDGELHTCYIKNNLIQIYTPNSNLLKNVKIEGDVIIPDALLQLEYVSKSGWWFITDVYCAKGYQGGFRSRYVYAERYSTYFEKYHIKYKPWFSCKDMAKVLKKSKEGIVIQDIYASPGKVYKGGGYTYGSARYWKKVWTVDVYISLSCQLSPEGVNFTIPGVYEITLDSMKNGYPYIATRFRTDKNTGNTNDQVAFITNALSLDDLLKPRRKNSTKSAFCVRQKMESKCVEHLGKKSKVVMNVAKTNYTSKKNNKEAKALGKR